MMAAIDIRTYSLNATSALDGRERLKFNDRLWQEKSYTKDVFRDLYKIVLVSFNAVWRYDMILQTF